MTAGSIAKTEMDDLVARLDRDNFPYGCFADWPPALKVTTRMMMASRFPMFIAWGEELPFLYNGACIPIFGARHPDAFGRPFKQVWPEVWDELSPLLFRALQGETIYRERLPLQLWRDGRMQPAWFTFSYSPLFDADGAVRGVLSVSVEETAAVVAEKQRQLLVNELNHRVKNSLAVVQGIAAQSFRDGLTSKDAREAFEGRLAAMGKAHSLLSAQSWESALLSDVVEQALSAGADKDRFHPEGPSVLLPPQTSVMLALALHELVTNALKYGALKQPGGSVSVRWQVSDQQDGTRGLQIVWQERGGPPVSLPTTRGFGSRLLEYGLSRELQGEVTLDFAEQGLVCQIDARIPAVAA